MQSIILRRSWQQEHEGTVTLDPVGNQREMKIYNLAHFFSFLNVVWGPAYRMILPIFKVSWCLL